MKTVALLTPEKSVEGRARLYRRASILALVTIFFNLLEGGVSVFFGLEDETVAEGRAPETTFWGGIVVSLVSIAAMWVPYA